MWKLWLHVALLFVMLVVVGLMTRWATQVVSCMRGHLGKPWCHGRCELLVWVLVHGVSHASRRRQDTRTSWLHSHCLLALRSWDAHWGLDELSANSYPGESNRLGTGQARVTAGWASYFASLLLRTRHVQVRWGMWRTLGAHEDQVMAVFVCVQSQYHAESSRQRGRNMCECDPTQTSVCKARSLSQLSPSLAAS